MACLLFFNLLLLKIVQSSRWRLSLSQRRPQLRLGYTGRRHQTSTTASAMDKLLGGQVSVSFLSSPHVSHACSSNVRLRALRYNAMVEFDFGPVCSHQRFAFEEGRLQPVAPSGIDGALSERVGTPHD